MPVMQPVAAMPFKAVAVRARHIEGKTAFIHINQAYSAGLPLPYFVLEVGSRNGIGFRVPDGLFLRVNPRRRSA